MTKLFYAILANTVVASVVNTVVWFAVTFWAYLQTESVVVTSVMAGIYLVTVALSGFALGSVVDRYQKKTAMMVSSLGSMVLYSLALIVYATNSPTAFTNPSSPILWLFIVLVLGGSIAGNLRGIALSTLVTLMIPEAQRDRANGMVGTAHGVSFLIGSIFSGLAIGFIGVYGMMVCAVVLIAAVLAHLATLPIPQTPHSHSNNEEQHRIDLRGSIRAVRAVPGLMALIFFHTFNNFLGGVFMSLMDAYGLLLVSVEVWGILWGILSLGFIVGGIVVARRGLGKNPMRSLLLANIAMWTISMLFPIQSSIVLLSVGMFIYLCLIPVAEAAEQTVLQKMIPPERQGRVFGFAQSVEQAASPVTAFMVGPIAEWFFIPFMTTGAGVALLGDWFGVGKDRGIALLFIAAGVIGLAASLLAMRSRAYRNLSGLYEEEPAIANANCPERQYVAEAG